LYPQNSILHLTQAHCPQLIYLKIQMAFIGAMPPLALMQMPFGVYTISYDISTNETEGELPNGWGALRGQ
jgi:hypothetical protein